MGDDETGGITRAAPAPASPVVRPISWAGALGSFVLLAIVIGAATLIEPARGGLVGATLFLAFRFLVVRRLLCRDHVAGLRALREGDLEAALAAFRRSESRWRERRLLDRFRGLLLGSASLYDFLTLARYNQAFCLARLGRADEALAILDDLLATEPDNGMAATLRDLLRARERG